MADQHNVIGTIVALQESRFRLKTENGDFLLFSLSNSAALDPVDLSSLKEERQRVNVTFSKRSKKLESAVAHEVRVISHGGKLGAHEVPTVKLRRSITQRATAFFRDWSLRRQLAGEDSQRAAARSSASEKLNPRLHEADKVGTSVCPYCAVGCAQLLYAKNGVAIHVEGDPRSPVNQGTLCPKGAATISLLNNPKRLRTVKYRAPFATAWEDKPLDWAMERIAQLVKRTRDETFVHKLPDGEIVNHTLGIGCLGGATFDNEENYLIKKVFGGGLGIVSIENQARI